MPQFAMEESIPASPFVHHLPEVIFQEPYLIYFLMKKSLQYSCPLLFKFGDSLKTSYLKDLTITVKVARVFPGAYFDITPYTNAEQSQFLRFLPNFDT